MRAGFLDLHRFVLVQVIVEGCVSSEDMCCDAKILFVQFVDVFGEIFSPHLFEEGIRFLGSVVFPFELGSVLDSRFDAASRDRELYHSGF